MRANQKRDDDEETAGHHDVDDVVERFAVEIEYELEPRVFHVLFQRVSDVMLLHPRRHQMPDICTASSHQLTVGGSPTSLSHACFSYLRMAFPLIQACPTAKMLSGSLQSPAYLMLCWLFARDRLPATRIHVSQSMPRRWIPTLLPHYYSHSLINSTTV